MYLELVSHWGWIEFINPIESREAMKLNRMS